RCAVGAFSGLYTSKPRDRGVHYNQIVAKQKTRDALGWRLDTAWRPQGGRLEVSVADATGQPLAGARLTVELIRPVEKRPPLPVVLAEIEPGRFAGSVELPARGNWDL